MTENKDKDSGLVQMVRSEDVAGGGPLTADVHPAEVENYAAHGWKRLEEGRPGGEEEPPDPELLKELDGTVDEVVRDLEVFETSELLRLLEGERQGKKRKGVIDVIEAVLAERDDF